MSPASVLAHGIQPVCELMQITLGQASLGAYAIAGCPHLTSLALPPHYLFVSSRVDVGLARKLELALLILVAGFLIACGTEEEAVSPSPSSSAASPQTPAASPTVVATISVGSKPWDVALNPSTNRAYTAN